MLSMLLASCTIPTDVRQQVGWCSVHVQVSCPRCASSGLKQAVLHHRYWVHHCFCVMQHLKAMAGTDSCHCYMCRHIPQAGPEDARKDPAPPVHDRQHRRDQGSAVGHRRSRPLRLPQQCRLCAPTRLAAAHHLLPQPAAPASRGAHIPTRSCSSQFEEAIKRLVCVLVHCN